MVVLNNINKILEEFISSKENFSNDVNNSNNSNNSKLSNAQVVALVIVLILWFVLIILVGRYLWNECLCKVVSVCKPTDDLFVILGVILLLDILNPRL